MKITAAVVPVRSAPFEMEALDLAAPLADDVLVRVVASGICDKRAAPPGRALPSRTELTGTGTSAAVVFIWRSSNLSKIHSPRPLRAGRPQLPPLRHRWSLITAIRGLLTRKMPRLTGPV